MPSSTPNFSLIIESFLVLRVFHFFNLDIEMTKPDIEISIFFRTITNLNEPKFYREIKKWRTEKKSSFLAQKGL